MTSLYYSIAVALNLETSDLGIDYEKGCQIYTDFDKRTVYIVQCTCNYK